MSADARIAHTFTLPSNGKIYTEAVNPTVILGSMKTKHEMLRLSATTNNNKIMAEILDDCIEGDMGISSYDLCLGDYQYLLFMLRTVTYGPEYEIIGICPNCGSQEDLKINLHDLEINEYDDKLADILTVHLPESNVDVTLTLQTPRLLDKIKRQAQDRKRKSSTIGDTTLLYTITNSIESIDNEQVNPFTLESWVTDLPMRDTNILLARINEINNYIGVQPSVVETCPTCGKDYDAPFYINGSFFRPDCR